LLLRLTFRQNIHHNLAACIGNDVNRTKVDIYDYRPAWGGGESLLICSSVAAWAASDTTKQQAWVQSLQPTTLLIEPGIDFSCYLLGNGRPFMRRKAAVHNLRPGSRRFCFKKLGDLVTAKMCLPDAAPPPVVIAKKAGSFLS